MLQIQTVVTQHLHMLQGESHISSGQILSLCDSIYSTCHVSLKGPIKGKKYIDITPRIMSLGRLCSFQYQNDIFIHPRTTGIKFHISRKTLSDNSRAKIEENVSLSNTEIIYRLDNWPCRVRGRLQPNMAFCSVARTNLLIWLERYYQIRVCWVYNARIWSALHPEMPTPQP